MVEAHGRREEAKEHDGARSRGAKEGKARDPARARVSMG